jgi:hypothetical protein
MKALPDWFGTFALIAAVTFVLGAIAVSYSGCRTAGGTLVQGLFWFECVQQLPHK